MTDEQRKVVEKATRAGYAAGTKSLERMYGDTLQGDSWDDTDDNDREYHTAVVEAALNSVDYFALVDVAEAAKGVIQGFGNYQLAPGHEGLGYGPYWSPCSSTVDTSLIASLDAALAKVQP